MKLPAKTNSYCMLLLILLMSNSILAKNYVAIAATYGGDSYLYDMTENGTLSYRRSIPSGDAPSVNISSDNSFVAITGLWDLSVSFYDNNGGLLDYVSYVDQDWYAIASAIDSESKKIFVGPSTCFSAFTYNNEILDINQIDKREGVVGSDLVFSSYSHTIYFHRLANTSSADTLQGMKLKVDDTFDTFTTTTYVGRHSLWLYITHDGRTLVSCSLEGAKVKIYRVSPDGGLAFVQDIPDLPDASGTFTCLFSPDDRFMYLVCDTLPELPIVRSYSVNPDTNEVTEISNLHQDAWDSPLHGFWINATTASITPDGRYLIVPHRLSDLWYSTIGVIRLQGPMMTMLPIQPDIRTPDYFNASGVAMFNTNATEPTWAQYE